MLSDRWTYRDCTPHLNHLYDPTLTRQALAGVSEEDRCQCPHTPIDGRPGVYEVKKGETGQDGKAKVDVGYEA